MPEEVRYSPVTVDEPADQLVRRDGNVTGIARGK